MNEFKYGAEVIDKFVNDLIHIVYPIKVPQYENKEIEELKQTIIDELNDKFIDVVHTEKGITQELTYNRGFLDGYDAGFQTVIKILKQKENK